VKNPHQILHDSGGEITFRELTIVHLLVDGEEEEVRVVLRSRAGRLLEVTRVPDGSLRIHGHDIGGGAEIFGSDEYEWFTTIPVERLERSREVFGVPDGVGLLEHLKNQFADDDGHRFEQLVRDHELSERFWSWP
jgi:hypothetical protein